MLRINWPRSAFDGDNSPTGQMLLHSAALDSAQENFGIRGAADQQRRRGIFLPGVAAHTGIAEIAIGKAQRREEGNLEEPEQDDRHLADEEGAMDVGRDQDVIEHEQCQAKHSSHAQYVERIRQRDEAPFRGGEVEEVGNRDAEHQEIRQDAQQQRHAVVEQLVAFEAQVECCKERHRRRDDVVHSDQQIAQSEMGQTRHSMATRWETIIRFQQIFPRLADSPSRKPLPAYSTFRNLAFPKAVARTAPLTPCRRQRQHPAHTSSLRGNRRCAS